MSDSDTALIARVLAHDDRGAFELLVRRHQSAVRNFFRRLARNDIERANDLAQETFIKMYQGPALVSRRSAIHDLAISHRVSHVPK